MNNPTLEKEVYQRYYHLFRKGELEHCIEAAGGKIIESGFERDNWWAQIQLNIDSKT